MNPSLILSIILPVIEQLPTIESGVMAVVKAISAMHASGGFQPAEIDGAIEQSLPAIAAAIKANTPSVTPAA